MRREHWPISPNSDRRVLAVADDLGSILLLGRKVEVSILDTFPGEPRNKRKAGAGSGCTYSRVAHRSHDSVGTGIKGTLDHPFFGPGHADNRASTLVADGISELNIDVSIRSSSSIDWDKPRNSGCR